MRKSFEFRLRPTRAQERCLIATLDACHFVYNWGVEDRKNLWGYCHISTNFFDQSGYLKTLKQQHPFLKEAHAHPLQDALKRVDRAFQAFFRRVKAGEKPGYPRFKGRDWYDSFTFQEWGNGCAFDGKRLFLSKIGRVRIVLHRSIVGQIKTCTIKHQADGWFVTFSVVVPDPEPSGIQNPIGIDVGLTTFAALSSDRCICNPRFLRKAECGLKRAQRKVSKRKKGSGRRRKAVQHLRLEHQHVARARKSFHFREAHRIVVRYNPIYVEGLNIQGMMQNHALAKSIGDASWGQFLNILSGSAESAGSAVIAVGAAGTSQECICGERVSNDLRIRTRDCPRCRLTVDRDVLSAKVVLKRGLQGLGRPFGEGVRSKKHPTTREAAGL